MKKIIGTIGLVLILTVTFFNTSLLVKAETDINLASLMEVASANIETSGDGWLNVYTPEAFFEKVIDGEIYDCKRSASNTCMSGFDDPCQGYWGGNIACWDVGA